MFIIFVATLFLEIMKRSLFFYSVLFTFLIACGPTSEKQGKIITPVIKTGSWRGVLTPQEIEVPFQFQVNKNGERYAFVLQNAEERIPLEDVKIENDSIHIPLYIFDAAIHARIDGDKMTGVWVKNYAEDYRVPFEANYGNEERFAVLNKTTESLFEGKWEVDFITDDEIGKAIGVFKQNGNKLTGTFLTATGDYRFLEGVVDGDLMKLSCFDGTRAYLFEASIDENNVLSGEFWSGKTWHQKWTAKRNDAFELPDPYAMTFIKEGYEKFEFKFPNTSGNLIQLNDERYKNKVVVVQILGSWCANCMDETSFLVDWYERNKDRDVAIIGLAFERKADAEYAINRINKMKEKLHVNYEILIAGSTSAESKEKALPMLNKIMSFPTSIVLDKQHKVRQIHTGFSGPGTGVYYDKFVEEFNLLMDKLISE